jgi:nicotinate dehydrogenase subunit B
MSIHNLWTSLGRGGFGQTNRRDFMKITGTGVGLLLICSAAGPLTPKASAQEGPPPFAKDFNAYFHIDPSGKVTGFVGKVEIGSGQKTALTQVLAEELDLPVGSIEMVMGDTDRCPWDMGTFGSLTFNLFQTFFRASLAEARAVLLAMAAEKLQVPADKLQVKDGVISVIGTPSKSVSYGKLVDGKRVEKHIETKIPTKDIAAWKVMGTPLPRVDAIEKVTGKAKYVADLGMPGTVYARVVRPERFGAKLKSIDTSAAEAAGMQVVRDGDFVALVGDKPDLVEKALALVKAEWQREPDGLDNQTIFAHLQQTKFAEKLELISEKGSLAAGEKLISTAVEGKDGIVERSYTTAYAYHAPMETHTDVARFENGKLTLWAATQAPFAIQHEVLAHVLKMDPKNIRVIAGPYVGGGFGGKSENPTDNIEAARIAMMVPGKTVQVVWSRAEDIMYDAHRPAAIIKVRSGLTPEGKVGYYDYKAFGAGDWGAETKYDLPNQRSSWVGHWHFNPAEITQKDSKPNPPDLQPFNVGPWRGPATVSNTFANESAMDEMAVAAGVDPAEFRLRHLESDKRMRSVLEAALKQFGYQPAAKSPSGRGIGVSCGYLYGTYTCSVAQVEVDKQTGAVKVLRVVNATDAGQIVNQLGAAMQVEGCIIFGVGTALGEEVRFSNGKFATTNFDNYEIARFSSIPKIEVVLVKSPVPRPLGIGEPPIASVAPAIANAIYDAAGVRVRHLPMTPERIKAALQKA